MSSLFLAIACTLIYLATACNRETTFGDSGSKRAKASNEVTSGDATAGQQTGDGLGQESASPTASPVASTLPGVRSLVKLSVLKNSGLLDLVWVIDNSGSMAEEVAQVRKNFASFIQTMPAALDIRVFLVSAKEGTKGMILDPELLAKGHVQIPQFINSNDGLEKAVEATKELSSRFRDGAARGYVFVTDDDAIGITDSSFIELLQIEEPELKPVVFAFRGELSQPGCKIAAPGKAYNKLAAATGGEVYDICATDWSPHFAKLTSKVNAIAQKVYQLPAGTLQSHIESIKVDGVLMPTNNYRIVNSLLIFNTGSLKVSSQTIEVVIVR